MKTKIIALFLIVLALPALAQYRLTNNLNSAFTTFVWTNNGTTTSRVVTSNLLVGSNVVFSASTNGNGGIGLNPTNTASTFLIGWSNAPFGGAYVGTLFSTAIKAAAPAVETVPQAQTILESYFISGARPTQANYWELIDTMFWYANQTYTNALLAQQSAAQLGNIILAGAKFSIATHDSNGYWDTNTVQVLSTNNVGNISVTIAGGTSRTPTMTCVFKFLTPLPTANYAVYFPSGDAQPGIGSAVYTTNVTTTITNLTAIITMNSYALAATNTIGFIAQ